MKYLEIPYETQANVLRVLIDQKFKRINGNNDINVDVRLICSSSKDLKEEIKIGNFREDLFHRLNVIKLSLPKLSEKKRRHTHFGEAFFPVNLLTRLSEEKKYLSAEVVRVFYVFILAR